MITVSPVMGFSGERVLTLSRAFPANNSVDVLRARDRVRHARILQGFAGAGAGVVDFNVFGNSDPYYGG